MKKILKSRIFLVIICGIIFTSIGVLAAEEIIASDVKYKNTTVEKALDSLYYKNIDSLEELEKQTTGVAAVGDYFYVYTPKTIDWEEAGVFGAGYEKIVFCHKAPSSLGASAPNFTATLPFSIDGKSLDIKLIKKINDRGWNPSARSGTSGNNLNIDVNYGTPEDGEYYFLIGIK